MTYMLWLVGSALAFALGEFCSKYYALYPDRPRLLVSIFIAYNVGVALWVPAIVKTKELAITGTIWSVLSLFATVLIGAVIFSERLAIIHWIGVSFAVLSVICLTR